MAFLAGVLVGACLRPLWRWLAWVCRRSPPFNVWSKERQQMWIREDSSRR